MRSIRSLFMLVLLSSLMLLVACGTSEEEASTGTETGGDSTEETPAEDTSYTIDHSMGTATIEGTPEKVVILTNEGTEALLALGVTPVGAVQSWLGNPDWYDHIADQMEGVQVVGTESDITIEAIAALQPDLIIGNKLRQEKFYSQLNKIAPTVMAETLKGDWKENFTLYAKALNKEEKGKEVLAAYDQRIEDLKAELGDKLTQEVSIVRFLAGDVRIYQKDSFSGVVLDQLGFARPESQNVNEFAIKGATKEMIPQMEGDILFYFTYEDGKGEASAVEEEWLNDPLFQKLEVVQAGNIHEVSDPIWNTAGGVLAANLMLDDIEKFFIEQ